MSIVQLAPGWEGLDLNHCPQTLLALVDLDMTTDVTSWQEDSYRKPGNTQQNTTSFQSSWDHAASSWMCPQ